MDRSGLCRFLANYFLRSQLPSPYILASINTATIGTPDEEYLRLLVIRADASPETKQAAIYRLMLAIIAIDTDLPVTVTQSQSDYQTNLGGF